MILIFDIALLLLTSIALGTKSLYLGTSTLIVGLLIHFQCIRVRALIGKRVIVAPLAKRVKAAVLSIVIGLCIAPFLVEGAHTEKEFNQHSLIPMIVAISMFAAVAMVSLVVERRRR